MENSNKSVDEAAEYLKNNVLEGEIPEITIQTGSGFVCSNLLDEIYKRIPLAELPGMPEAHSPADHELSIEFGLCGQRKVLLFRGRRHLYEGLGTMPCVLPVSAACKAGAPHVVVLSTSGSLISSFGPGSLLVVTDYFNNLGVSPLMGTEPLAGESPFLDMSEPFSHRLGSTFINAADAVDFDVRLGTYQANLGPQYETKMELNMARQVGADVLGMSIVPETIAASACGAEVLGLALVTNLVADFTGACLHHEEVKNIAAEFSPQIIQALRQWIIDAEWVE